MINRGHDTLSCSIEACCLSDTENTVTISFFFIDFDELEVYLKYEIYIFLFITIHRKITAYDHFSNLNSSSIRPDKNEINQSKSIQSYNIKVKNTFAYNSKN